VKQSRRLFIVALPHTHAHTHTRTHTHTHAHTHAHTSHRRNIRTRTAHSE
jgi:hypothetical protein